MPRKPSSSGTKSTTDAKRSPFWIPPGQDTLRQLREVSRRLRESDARSRRLAAEHADISPEEYIARLRKSKERLIREAKALREKDFISPLGARYAASHVQRRSAQGSAEAKYSFSRGKIMNHDPAMAAAMAALVQAQQAQPGPCIAMNDYIPPTATYVADYSGEIHHGSTKGMAVDEANLDEQGTTLATAFLNDDAAWYRNDSPDFYLAGYALDWTLPQAPCDMWVICAIDAFQHIDYENAADEGGWCRTGVLARNTDEQGTWLPAPLSSGTITFDSSGIYSWGSTVSEMTSDLASAILDSDRLLVSKTFPILAGRIPGFELVHYVELAAQDGRVEVVPVFGTHQRGVEFGAPSLMYFMIPQGGGCFITSAICGALGKRDDCEELQTLRRFRDTYVRLLPEGPALIAHYYRRAPRLLAALGNGRRTDAALRALHERYLSPALQAIERCDNRRALTVYGDMLADLEREAAISR
jgi:hypothetical protein